MLTNLIQLSESEQTNILYVLKKIFFPKTEQMN